MVLLQLETPAITMTAGDALVIRGSMGTGKFSVLRRAMGLVDDERPLCLLDTPRAQLSDDVLPGLRGRCALIPHMGALISNLSARDNVALPLRYRGHISHEDAYRRAEQALELLGCASIADARPADLNDAEQRMIALSRAEATGTELLLLQDPLAGMSDEMADRVVWFAKRVLERNGAVLITTATAHPLSAWDGKLAAISGIQTLSLEVDHGSVAPR